MSKEANYRARDKWLAEKVENITFRVPKGQKEPIKLHSKKINEYNNAFIYRAIQ